MCEFGVWGAKLSVVLEVTSEANAQTFSGAFATVWRLPAFFALRVAVCPRVTGRRFRCAQVESRPQEAHRLAMTIVCYLSQVCITLIKSLFNKLFNLLKEKKVGIAFKININFTHNQSI